MPAAATVLLMAAPSAIPKHATSLPPSNPLLKRLICLVSVFADLANVVSASLGDLPPHGTNLCYDRIVFHLALLFSAG